MKMRSDITEFPLENQTEIPRGAGEVGLSQTVFERCKNGWHESPTSHLVRVACIKLNRASAPKGRNEIARGIALGGGGVSRPPI